MRRVNIDKLNFVAKALTEAREELQDISDKTAALRSKLRAIEKTFNYSKGALKTWQEWYVSSTEKKVRSLEDENEQLKKQQA